MERVLGLAWMLIGFSLCVPVAGQQQDRFASQRQRLVRDHIEKAGVSDKRVLAVMRKTPRHEFVPEAVRRRAYLDTSLPIGFGQTISSPYIVARMTEQIEPTPDDRILEIGTGSGYQAAVLSRLVKEVYSVEIVPGLGERAQETLSRLGYNNVDVLIGDGYNGWVENAPFDKIIVTCSPENIPDPLVDQLAEGGHLVIPIGEGFQQALCRYTKTNGELIRQRIESTYFVPMTGKADTDRTQPSAAKWPELVNGGFEEKSFEGKPNGWYYVRNGRIRRGGRVPEGQQSMEIRKPDGSPARAIQPLGVDGRVVKRLSTRGWSRAENLQPELVALQRSQLILEFYDEQRKRCGSVEIPVPQRDFDWKQFSSKAIEVPESARMAILQIGLFGMTGTIWFDDVQVAAE